MRLGNRSNLTPPKKRPEERERTREKYGEDMEESGKECKPTFNGGLSTMPT